MAAPAPFGARISDTLKGDKVHNDKWDKAAALGITAFSLWDQRSQ
jgi:hypothetical protein